MPLSIDSVLCDGRENPIGIGHPEPGRGPAFSWSFEATGEDVGQSAWRIEVSERASADVLWDSGRVDSASSGPVVYAGRKLSSRTSYAVRLHVWDRDGRALPAFTAGFETGLLEQGDWSGAWIGGFPQLRRSFRVDAPVRLARAYVTAVGYYELSINGRRVGDHVLDPSHTDYARRVEYATHDVTNFLEPGENVVGLLLGHGFPAIDPWRQPDPYALLQIEWLSVDGTRGSVVTDDLWTGTSDGPIRANSLYDGETYDARREIPGWDAPGFAGSWAEARLHDDPGGLRVPQLHPPIRVVDEWRAAAVSRLDDGSFVVDAGIYLTGWVRLTAAGDAGQTVTLRYAEMLHADGSVNQSSNMRAACTDTWTLRGGGVDSWEPRFTYHGFRYVQVDGYPGDLTADKVVCRFACSDIEPTTTFACSNPLLNRIHEILVRAVRCNLFGFPADCANRSERRGWLTAGSLSFGLRARSFASHGFYRKWLDDILDVVDPATGRMRANNAPRWGETSRPNLVWMSALVTVPVLIHRYFDDVAALQSAWPAMVRWIDTVWDECTDGLYRAERDDGKVDFIVFAGDWLGIDSPHWEQVANASLIATLDRCVYAAQVLGEADDEARLRVRAAASRAAYHGRYYASPPPDFSIKTASEGWYGSFASVTQLGQVLPLLYDVPPEDIRPHAWWNFLQDLTESRGTPQVTTGILTGELFALLEKEDRHDIAYRLFARTEYPGWGFMVENGATTCWERWKRYEGKEMNSLCHVELTGAGEWLYGGLAGITSRAEPGTGRLFRVRPWFEPELSRVELAEKTQWGTVAVRWERTAGTIQLQVVVPPNTRADIDLGLPGGRSFVCRPAGPADRTTDRTAARASLTPPTGSVGRLEIPGLGSGAHELVIEEDDPGRSGVAPEATSRTAPGTPR